MQLHRLLSTEGSTKVPEEHKKQRVFFPEVPEITGCSIGHGHADIRGFIMWFG